MGRPYSSDLRDLAGTYRWALKAETRHLRRFAAQSCALPLLVVGSGGSFSAAQFVAGLHERYAGKLAKAVTPLEIALSPRSLRDEAVLVLSAGGSNPDALGVFKNLVVREPRQLAVLCVRERTPLDELASQYRYANSIAFQMPSGKDGFLATNSLLATAALSVRAYQETFGERGDLPRSLRGLIREALPGGIREFRSRCLPLWEREYLTVLFGPDAHPAAQDIESKFTEGALGAVQIADYRNFAHGRHHWLAKRGDTTGVLAFLCPSDRDIAGKTLRHIPDSIPIVPINIGSGGSVGGLSALICAFYLAGFAGEARGVDPGEPRVPPFGRKIYRLSGWKDLGPYGDGLHMDEAVAIERKCGVTIHTLKAGNRLSMWREAYTAFCSSLRRTQFRAVVFDYDGTLCDGSCRESGPSKEMTSHLRRLLGKGIAIGIATGRGRSAREQLRSALSKSVWANVFMGYYNGSDVGRLCDDDRPDRSDDVHDSLASLARHARLEPGVQEVADVTFRRRQITFELRDMCARDWLASWIWAHIGESCAPGARVVTSAHSLDVIAPCVSKNLLVSEIRTELALDTVQAVLCVGDRGLWPGNDYALLANPSSLSVDEVSGDPRTCWNLAPAGFRGVQATLFYLGSARIGDGAFQLSM